MDTRELRDQLKRATEDVDDGVGRFHDIIDDLVAEIEGLKEEVSDLEKELEQRREHMRRGSCCGRSTGGKP